MSISREDLDKLFDLEKDDKKTVLLEAHETIKNLLASEEPIVVTDDSELLSDEEIKSKLREKLTELEGFHAIRFKISGETISTETRNGTLFRQKLNDKSLLPEIGPEGNYKALIKGNDPVLLTGHEIKKFKTPSKNRLALIGTSCMRAVELACQLGSDENFPKIFIIDNSMQVNKFWRDIKKMIGNHKKNEFLKELKVYLDQNYLSHLDTKEDAEKYIKKIIEDHGYDYIQKVIRNTTLLRGSWAEKDIFDKLPALIKTFGCNHVVAYPSNIVPYVQRYHPELTQQTLENIISLKPALSIHTDLPAGKDKPTKSILIADHSDITKVAQQLNVDCTPLSTSSNRLG